MNRRARACLLFLLSFFTVAAASAGCRPEFAPYNRVTALRVLAIQSEPPTPLSGETATFTPLVFTPTAAPDPTLTYHWSWCPFVGLAADAYRCPVGPVERAQIDELLASQGAAPLPSFDLGTAPTATFTNDLNVDLMRLVCGGMLPLQPPGAKIDCTLGYPIQIMLTVSTDTDTVTAVQNVKLRADSMIPENLNPAFNSVSALIGSMEMALADPATAPPSVTLRRDVGTPLRVDLPETAAEVYAGLDDDGAPATLTERLFLTWFVESGDTDDPRTSFFSGSTDFAALVKNVWTPAKVKDYTPTMARVFVVAHDNRGGVAWRAGAVNLEASP